MDPLSALSLAANVIQFVDFSFELLNSSRKIYNSISGTSEDGQHLQKVHSELPAFSTQLRDDKNHSAKVIPAENQSEHSSSLRETAEACRKDCERLLGIIEKLKVKSGTRRKWWQSFSIAILEVWKSKDVERLKKRIDEYRNSMILKLCAISK